MVCVPTEKPYKESYGQGQQKKEYREICKICSMLKTTSAEQQI